jgi:hypothetical protein
MSPTNRFATIAIAIALVIGGCGSTKDESVAATTATTEPATLETETSAGDSTETSSPEATDTTDSVEASPVAIEGLWSEGLINLRNGELMVFEGGEHQLDPATVSAGYNVVADEEGNLLAPSGAPFEGGEQLLITVEYQEDVNVRGAAEVFTYMAPIRDAILYGFDTLTVEEWADVTAVLTVNGIKTVGAATVSIQAILSSEQVYEYVSTAPSSGAEIARFLEEAELELKCLAFVDFDFTNPEGANHCVDHDLDAGSGIQIP